MTMSYSDSLSTSYTTTVTRSSTHALSTLFFFRYSVLLPMTAVYCVIAVGGAVGNVLTCLVVAKNRTMRTSTNYYLVNLAVADLLTLFIGESLMLVFVDSSSFVINRSDLTVSLVAKDNV